jgi:hypothetical protein
MDARITKVLIYQIHFLTLNSLNPNNIQNYNIGRRNNDEGIKRNPRLITSNNPLMNNNNNPNSMMFNFRKEKKNIMNGPSYKKTKIFT